jgi:hypothetical protein
MRRFIWLIIVVPTGVLLAGCTQIPSQTADAGPDTPGWTGRTVVVGSRSTINDDLQATYWAQKWGIGQRR